MSALPIGNRYTLLFALLIVCSCGLQAQLSKGFKLLYAGRPAEAKEKFSPLLQHSELQAAAHYGLALATLETIENMQELMAAHQLMSTAISLGAAVPAKQRRQWIQKRWFAANPMPSFQQKLLNYGFQHYKQSLHLPQVDSLQAFVRGIQVQQSRKTRVDSLQSRLLRQYAAEADSYEAFSYLANTHADWLETTPNYSLALINDRMLMSYLQAYSSEGMDRFKRENPAHPALEDPWLDEFTRTMLDGSLGAKLSFCSAYTESMFVDWLLNDIANSRQKADNLSPQQQELLQAIRQSARGSAALSEAPSREDIDRYLRYTREFAPQAIGFKFFRQAMQHLLRHRLWDDALLLANTALERYIGCEACPSPSPYQAWFDNYLPLLRQPLEGISPSPLMPINTRGGSEVFPIISADGQSLYFVGRYRSDNLSGEDVFASTRDSSGQWAAPVVVSELSGEGNSGCMGITTDGREMLVFLNGKLCVSQKTETGWSSPQVIEELSQQFWWVAVTSYADNGQVIVFEARAHNDDNIDLYACRRDSNGRWQRAFPLGPTLNTPGRDRSPFVHADNRSLYFSSDGHGGLGKMDIFMTTRLDDSWTQWSTPVNVGKELNTLDDDLGFTITASGKEIYLSSIPEDDPYTYDLYTARLPSFVQPKPQQIVSLKIRQSPGVSIPVIATDAAGRRIADGFTLPDGSLSIALPADAPRPITFASANADNIFVPVVLSNTDSLQDIIRYESPVEVFAVSELSSGERSLKTRGIFFGSDADALEPAAVAELRAIYQLLTRYDLRIEVAGYADPDGSETYNLQLSQRRANRVRAQLVAWGYPADKVVAVGYGVPSTGNQPLSAEEKADCRRVEVRVKK